MANYEFKANINWLKRKRESLLKKLAKAKPFIDGSIVKVKRRCGNKNCKCAKTSYKHESFYLMYKVRGITKAVYIPVDVEGEVRKWSDEYKRVKMITKEICEIQKEIVRRHVTERRQRRGKK
ncbi:MAG: DUF6788 family protein [Candidatus Auribacterota bacterium]|nr:DUF6788 family protein [Candidatus Auribacterota bacterium]